MLKRRQFLLRHLVLGARGGQLPLHVLQTVLRGGELLRERGALLFDLLRLLLGLAQVGLELLDLLFALRRGLLRSTGRARLNPK